MNTVIIILLIVVGIIALLLIIAVFLKKKHYVNREIIINAIQINNMNWKKINLYILYSVTVFTFSCDTSSKISDTEIIGRWSGNCSSDSFNLSFQIQLSKDTTGYKASYRSDEQRALDIPLQKISFDTLTDSISFSLIGDFDSWNFKGKWINDSIIGIITKGKQVADFYLIKQSPEQSPYTKEEVVFQNDFFFRATPGYCDTIYNWINQTVQINMQR